MKKAIKRLLCFAAVLSLISCTNNQISSSVIDNSSVQPDNSGSLISSVPAPSSVISTPSSEAPSSNTEPVEVYYHVKFLNYDETLLYETDVLEGTEAVYKGEEPTKPEDDEFKYEFVGWDKDLKNIKSDITLVAQFKAVAKENWSPIIWF